MATLTSMRAEMTDDLTVARSQGWRIEVVGLHSVRLNEPRVHLFTLSIRTSAKGRPYLSGFLGKARVVAFEGKPDKWDNPTWDIFVQAQGPREVTIPSITAHGHREAI